MAHVIILAGLGFGDEGKGSLVDHYARTTNVGDASSVLVVRYNGGSQAAHNVVTPKGQHHTFAQFGSAALAGGATHLSRFMLVNPLFMDNEAKHLQQLGIDDPYERVTIEADALITNVYHVAANRLRELLRGENRHGSCGMGIGETVADSIDHPGKALRVQDLTDRHTLREKLQFSLDLKREEFRDAPSEILEKAAFRELVDFYLDRYLAFGDRLRDRIVGPTYLRDRLQEDRTVIFEGAQGVLLDQDHGFHPHTTWSDTTFCNAFELLGAHAQSVRCVGVLRAYHTRHGAGPLPSEFNPGLVHGDLSIFSGEHNCHNEWQQGFRVGHFDMALAKYALKVIGGVDELVLTNLDRLGRPHRPKICIGYRLMDDSQIEELPVQDKPVDLNQQERLTEMLATVRTVYGVTYGSPRNIVEAVQSELGKVSLCSLGPTATDKFPTDLYLNPSIKMDAELPRTWN